jgi:hypothetical protein
VSERRRSGRVVGIAEGVAATVRRRQREREPRVVLFDATGASWLVAPSAPGYDELLELADRMIAAGEESRPGGVDRRASGVGSEATLEEPPADAEATIEEPAADARRGTGRAPGERSAGEPPR